MKPLTVGELVAVLRSVRNEIPDGPNSDRVIEVLARAEYWEEMEEREEHRRALEAAESEAVEPW